MNGKHLVSIIIPVYNAVTYVRETIESALSQTYSPCEIIVVNDGSTDGSLDILNKYSERITIISQLNKGVSGARNRGVRESRGKYIAFLDSDDIWDKNKIERQVNILESHPDCFMTYCDHRIIDAVGNITGMSGATQFFRASGQVLKAMLQGSFIISPTVTLVRRSAFEKAGGFDETLHKSEDYDLWLRLALFGPILYQLETLASYRRHDKNTYTGPNLESSIARMNAIKKIALSPTCEVTEYRAACADALLKAMLNVAWHYRINRQQIKAFITHLQIIKLWPLNIRHYLNAMKSLVPKTAVNDAPYTNRL
ncbi:glycosyltransferase [Methylocaldum sp.]|uniref:glycosyltransferase n=1 Tax=Methylocaldum sp. TaxID=1969727 RepID=UPI002D49FD9E|nr:glycosyltransferase [Methylocaldum sp.]HYE37064.1 glycosyltransferase [Methylocaldum sp.]